MTYRAVDCFGFAGGMTLGVVRSGFELVGKRELPPGFGVKNCEVNRHLLGDRWTTEVSEPEHWTPFWGVDLVFGNPPCSGFSVMTDKKHRGVDAKVNACMHAFARYAARCAPAIAVMESVRPAFSKGRELMQQLRHYMEVGTGLPYNLYHVMHNARQLGGAGERPRYFWVASRIPFGVEWPLVRQPLLIDVIDDLKDLANTWQRQPYRRPATWWSASARSENGVDGHVTIPPNPGLRRAWDLLEMNGGWPQGWWIQRVAEKIYDEHGYLPASWSPYMGKLLSDNNGSGRFHMGYIQLTRWDESKPARVITGGAMGLVIHPTEDRTITHRECARIMGFPDDWLILPLRGTSSFNSTWGKGISVQCGEWIGNCVRAALDGQPGSITGKEIGDREYLINPPKQDRHFVGVNPTLVKKGLPSLVV